MSCGSKGNCGSGCSCFCPVTLGLAFGVASAIFMIAYAWMAMMFGYGTAMIDQYSMVYYGYAATFVGGLWGGLWGLIQGFIFGFLVAWFYDMFCRCKGKCWGKDKMGDSCSVDKNMKS